MHRSPAPQADRKPSRIFRFYQAAVTCFIIAHTAMLIGGCTDEKRRGPDVSAIKTPVSIQRFDQDFFALDTLHLEQGLDALQQKYPSFLPVYFEYMSPVNFIVQRQRESYVQAVTEYLRNVKSLADSADKKFASLDKIQTDLSNSLRYVKYYFPKFVTPAVVSTVESLNPENKDEIWGTLYFRDTLVISLQMFLGKDFSAYDPTQYFDYLRRRFETQYIVPNCLRAIANDIYPGTETDKLIEAMIEKGKQWWLLDKFAPSADDSLKTGFTAAQLKWCKQNEGNIWASVLQQTPDLYTVDPERKQNYLGESPRTMDLPEESPGNIGQWLGWQIVKKFEEKHSNMSVEQVLNTPAAAIFAGAKYKPK